MAWMIRDQMGHYRTAQNPSEVAMIGQAMRNNVAMLRAINSPEGQQAARNNANRPRPTHEPRDLYEWTQMVYDHRFGGSSSTPVDAPADPSRGVTHRQAAAPGTTPDRKSAPVSTSAVTTAPPEGDTAPAPAVDGDRHQNMLDRAVALRDRRQSNGHQTPMLNRLIGRLS